ncbi:CHAT domain-containing protein [Herbaspirillum sp. LeCh32-8]|uniref:CHAT domain-containing protein n=1 Tax=Herbaspirillum sp. LeCh32-8 TaxID=2821356 RepID=UPI001AEAC7B4|nr:CHAT domain-containing protein [Herbaspirillum sp. LeCh32-8]MBP0598868.1 CHAT domain-containing protein [Herbaspirillum sp. LeCh32-8]
MSDINYCILVPGASGSVTPLQGFNEEIPDPEFLALLAAVTVAPNRAFEIFMDHAEFLEQRREGSKKSIVVTGAELEGHVHVAFPGISIVIAPRKHIEKAKTVVKEAGLVAIILSTVTEEDVINIFDRDYSDPTFLDEEIFGKLKTFEEFAGKDWPALRKPYAVNLDLKSRGNGTVRTNEYLLLSLGFKFSGREDILGDIQLYIDAINTVLAKTKEVVYGNEPLPDLVLFTPGIASYLYDVRSRGWNAILRKVAIPAHRTFIKDGLIRNKGYAGFKIEFDDGLPMPQEDPIVAGILSVRANEVMATLASISLLCASTAAIPLRLPSEVNLLRSLLVEIQSFHGRSDNKAYRLLQEKYLEYAGRLNAAAAPFKDIIEQSSTITISSDVPLEWMTIDGVPLMISHEVSRIPMTPGNMLMQFSAIGPTVVIPRSSLLKVLVIRSFKKDDPIRTFLEQSVLHYKLDKMSVTFVDVNTKQDAIEALNQFDGYVVVFDCHGTHSGNTSHGWLQIGEEQLDTWQLAGVAKVPPVVILSACSTSSVTGSHASVANGLLRSGAYTVVGTFLDVDAIKSSAFVGRVLWRLQAFLPALRSLGFDTVTWRTMMSLFLRMAYATDILRYCEQIGLINAAQYREIHIAANHQINLANPHWYRGMIAELVKKSGRSEEEILARLQSEAAFVETMLYCQHGRPELIEIDLHG